LIKSLMKRIKNFVTRGVTAGYTRVAWIKASASTDPINWATFPYWLSFKSPIPSKFVIFKFYVLKYV
jgi:hypothetical protein